MNTRKQEILDEMKGKNNERYSALHIVSACELISIISDEQAVSSGRMEKQTNKIIRLTWALAFLTLLLFFLTGYLAYDVYANNEAAQGGTSSTTQKASPNP